MAYLAPAVRSGLATFQYIGGGTPNILDDRQLERLLGALNEQLRFAPDARRTFEFLPSALRPGQLERVRRFGYNRLSCGIQSQAPKTLLRVMRSPERLDDVGAILEEAFTLGFDEVNLDLVWGLPNEPHEVFVAGLLRTLALGPTTVTIHKLIPLKNRPHTPEEELEHDRAFLALRQVLQPVLQDAGLDFTLVHRINSLVVVRTAFLKSGAFSLSYYSDNERIHLDMVGLGRFASSRMMGECSYDCAAGGTVFDPDEARYEVFPMVPGTDAALDLITDLMADGHADLQALEARYGSAHLRTLIPELERLDAAGTLAFDGTSVRYRPADHVFASPLASLLEVTLPPDAEPPMRGETLHTDEGPVRLVVERAKPDQPYFAKVGSMGIFYRVPRGAEVPSGAVVDRAMAGVVERLTTLLDQSPRASAAELLAAVCAHDGRLGEATAPPGLSGPPKGAG